MMAILQKAFPFTTDLEGFVPTGGNADTTLDWSSVGGNPGGCASSRIFGRNKSADPTWDWDGTWEDLGVPAGATVTHAQIWCDWRCSEWNVGNTLTEFLYAAISDAAASVISQANGSAVSGTTAYETIAGSQGAVAAGNGDSTDAVNIGVDLYLRNGNNASAAVTLLFDNVVVEVTYTQGGTTYTKTVLVTVAAVPRTTRTGLFARALAAAASVVPSTSRTGTFLRTVRAVSSVITSAVAQRVAEQYQQVVSVAASVIPSVSRVGSFFRTVGAAAGAAARMTYDFSGQIYPSLRLKVITTKRSVSSVTTLAAAVAIIAIKYVYALASSSTETRVFRKTSMGVAATVSALSSVVKRVGRSFGSVTSVTTSMSRIAFLSVAARAVSVGVASVRRGVSRLFRAASSTVVFMTTTAANRVYAKVTGSSVAKLSRKAGIRLRAVSSSVAKPVSMLKALSISLKASGSAVARIVRHVSVVRFASSMAYALVSKKTSHGSRIATDAEASAFKKTWHSVRVVSNSIASALAEIFERLVSPYQKKILSIEILESPDRSFTIVGEVVRELSVHEAPTLEVDIEPFLEKTLQAIEFPRNTTSIETSLDRTITVGVRPNHDLDIEEAPQRTLEAIEAMEV